ncbi:MAG TPA: hypothetical protein VLF95_00585, partial [Vicinamibacteria bacterium]|nr:hypothetical protein [Vicinamibacteria bacterium]
MRRRERRRTGAVVEAGLHLNRHGVRDVGEEGEDVPEVPVVALGPDVLVGLAPDELRRDPDPVPAPQDRAFDEGV